MCYRPDGMTYSWRSFVDVSSAETTAVGSKKWASPFSLGDADVILTLWRFPLPRQQTNTTKRTWSTNIRSSDSSSWTSRWTVQYDSMPVLYTYVVVCHNNCIMMFWLDSTWDSSTKCTLGDILAAAILNIHTSHYGYGRPIFSRQIAKTHPHTRIPQNRSGR